MPKTVRPFADFLTDLNNGLSHDELGDKLNELISAVAEIGKTGTLTFVIKVQPAGRAEGMVQITDDIKLKLPVGNRPDSVWFVTPDGNVQRESPNQPRLPLKGLDSPATTTLKETQAQ